MAAPKLFFRLMIRPLGRDLVRTLLTMSAVSLGVAVVVAIHLAGLASTGSFRSSLESLTGDAGLEISTIGGLDERLLGRLVRLPYPLRFSPRVEGFGVLLPAERSVPVFGFDLIGDRSLGAGAGEADLGIDAFAIDSFPRGDAVWAGPAVASRAGETIRLRVNDQTRAYAVQGILDTSGFGGASRDNIVVMDIALAQRVLSKRGRLDKIEVFLPDEENQRDWEAILRKALPAGVTLRPQGAATSENRRMLHAFQWNLRVLSYVSLVVGAFLIYNTISISVVRRRAEIGVLRALGASRRAVSFAFLAEAGFFGLAGAGAGLLLGRGMAGGAVEMMASTVSALYVSSTPGKIEMTAATVLVAVVSGVGVSLLSALAPAREAARIPPSEAMARGRRPYLARLRVRRDLLLGGLLFVAAWLAALPDPVGGMPLFGYLSALLLIASFAFATPAFLLGMTAAAAGLTRRLFGVEGLLAPRGLIASLDRTAVLVAALATAVAMLVSVALLVGSYRETLIVWLQDRLRADFYLRPQGPGGAGRYPTMDAEIAGRIAALPQVLAVDRFRAYPISYNGLPATLASGQSEVAARWGNIRFLSGDPGLVLRELPRADNVIISEPFANKHKLSPGDTLRLPLGRRKVSFRILGVYYDYSNEKGYVIADRAVLRKYLPDPSLSSIAVYLREGASAGAARNAIGRVVAGRDVTVAFNSELRQGALKIFDRTFGITYALQAVAMVVAILGMAGALLAMVLDRRREMGVLRFLGASAGQIRRLILFESGLLGMLSSLLGLVLGTLLSLILIFVINKQSFGWTIQFHVPMAQLLGALSLICLAAILSGIYPAHRAARFQPMEGVHEE